MTGVTHIQVMTTLHFDDGNIVTLSTPIWNKDIRAGDYFSNDLICEVVKNGGIALADMIEETTTRGIHYNAVAMLARKNPQQGRIRPGPFDMFSNN